MNIQTDKLYMFFVKEFQDGKSYSIGMSKKDKEGKYINFFVPVTITKNVQIEDKQKAYIRNAWLEPYKDKEDKTRLKIVINGIELVEETIEKSKLSDSEVIQKVMNDEPDPFKSFGDVMEFTDDDLPF